MIRKRVLAEIFLSVILLLTFVSAQCADNQTIFSLYHITNSHAAVFNSTYSDPFATQRVCYTGNFPIPYSKPNPWICNGNNSILNLSGQNNAHAGIGYNQEICYGDLKCEIRSGSCLAGSNEVAIASLFSLTNSHISKGNDPFYNYKICCINNATGTPPVNPPRGNISIIGIEDGKSYLTGIPLTAGYIANESDEVGIQLIWNIPEDNLVRQTGLGESLLINFTTTGQKTVKVSIYNNNGPLANFELSVLAINGEGTTPENNLLAFIKSPKHRELIKLSSSEIMHGKTITYDGNESYVIASDYNISSCSGTIRCIAGACPDSVTNFPSCSLANITVTDYNMKNYGNLNFNWFDYSLSLTRLTGGNAVLSGIAVYPNTKFSKAPHDKQIDLKLNYTSGNLYQENKRAFTLGQCIYNSRGYIAGIDKGIETSFATVEARLYGAGENDPSIFRVEACKGPDAVNGTVDDCCPAGFRCTANQGCVIINNYVPGCSSKTTQESCENTPVSEAIDHSGIDSTQCGVVNKYCKWNNGACTDFNEYINITDGVHITNKSVEFRNLTSCDASSGYWQVNITTTCSSTCTPSSECGNSTVAILPCGLPLFKVPVFGIWQFIITLLGIFSVYFLLRKK